MLLGNLLALRRDPLDFLTRCARQYGDITRYRVLRITVYLLNHPDHIESVLAANPRDFHKGRALRAARSLLGNGLLTSEGEDWRRQRRSAQPAFHRERLAAFSPVIVDCAQRMLSRWRNGETRDIDRDLARLTLNITCAGYPLHPPAFFDQH